MKRSFLKRRTEGQRTVRVLIADAEDTTARAMRDLLESKKHVVLGLAADMDLAVDLTKQLKPDLVIMDSRIPRRRGWELTRSAPQQAATPVLILTEGMDEATRDEALKESVYGILTKQARDEDLLNMIQVAIARFEELSEMKKAAEELEDALETRKVVERAKGLLMEQLGLPENDAYVRLRTRSQQESKSMRQIAEAVITAYEISEKHVE